MIDRYSRKEFKNIWADENKYKIWLDIELAAAEAMEKLKIIPKGVVKKVRSKAKINVARILEIEESVKHDVIAFLTTPFGIILNFSIASAAANSISNQILYLFSSDQIFFNSFLEYLSIILSRVDDLVLFLIL